MTQSLLRREVAADLPDILQQAANFPVYKRGYYPVSAVEYGTTDTGAGEVTLLMGDSPTAKNVLGVMHAGVYELSRKVGRAVTEACLVMPRENVVKSLEAVSSPPMGFWERLLRADRNYTVREREMTEAVVNGDGEPLAYWGYFKGRMGEMDQPVRSLSALGRSLIDRRPELLPRLMFVTTLPLKMAVALNDVACHDRDHIRQFVESIASEEMPLSRRKSIGAALQDEEGTPRGAMYVATLDRTMLP